MSSPTRFGMSQSSTIVVLKQLLQLEEKREGLQQQLAALDAELSGLRNQLITGTPVASTPKVKGKPGRKPGRPPKVAPTAAEPAAKTPKPKAAPRGRRGAMAEKIVALLKEAGEKGITIKELSAKLKADYRNIQVWFATTGKKRKEIKKIAPATYRLLG